MNIWLPPGACLLCTASSLPRTCKAVPVMQKAQSRTPLADPPPPPPRSTMAREEAGEGGPGETGPRGFDPTCRFSRRKESSSETQDPAGPQATQRPCEFISGPRAWLGSVGTRQLRRDEAQTLSPPPRNLEQTAPHSKTLASSCEERG